MQTDYSCAGHSSDPEHEAFTMMEHLLSQDATEDERDRFLRHTVDNQPSAEEVSGFSRAIRSRSILPRIPGLLDIVGTGGDGKNTVNVSTASAISASALGIGVAKHGNRGITSSHGSADFMRYIGYEMAFTPDEARKRLNRDSFLYLLAPQFNSAFASFTAARKRIGRRTVFNIMGPLTNPVDPDFMILGSFNMETAEIYAKVLSLRSKAGVCFSSTAGMDEISPVGETAMFYVRDGRISRSVVRGESITGETSDLAAITEPDPQRCFQKTMDGLTGRNRQVAQFIALNTAPALILHGRARDMQDAYDAVMRAIESGRVAEQAKRIVR
jgi:anthranilate phosphoribosyltransferase